MSAEQNSLAAEYACVTGLKRRTVLAYFKAHNIHTLRDVRAAFPRPGRVGEDMQEAITEWVMGGRTMNAPAKAKHTPGPWRQNGFQIEGPRMGLVVATATSVRVGWAPNTEAEGRANARLIAAAPDLLAALKRLANCPEVNFDEVEPETDAARVQGLAAIAKAEGAQ